MTSERLLPRIDLQEAKPAFNVSSIWNRSEAEIEELLVEYLPYYVIEQGDQTLREKTTTGVWLVKNGEVIHPTLGPVINYVSRETVRDQHEFEAFGKIRDYLVEAKPDSIVCWFSPATSSEFDGESYTESRTVVYFLKEEDGEKRVHWFEFCSYDSFEEQRQIANSFRAYSEEEYYFPNLEKMRVTPILLEGVSLQEVVEEVASYERVWGDIASGKVTARMQKVINAATEIAPGAAARIKKAARIKTREAAVRAGATVEREMEARVYWSISFLGGCGFSNNALISLTGIQSKSFYSPMMALTESNKILNTEKKIYCKRCPYCDLEINAYISPGFECPRCHKVYAGVC